MSNRITRNDIYQALKVLNGTLESEGHRPRYSVEIWSPGDGWSRYQLYDESRGHREMSLVMTLRQCYDALFCLIKLADLL